ncbi:MAG: flippase-like domain-containing protein [Bacteroidaceae bacterium]|nr:flippase-like domain-containing protein [Bacteroidaceae bacterium]
MKKILNIILKTGAPLLLGAVILFWIYRNFDFDEVLTALKGMNLGWFWLSCVFGVLSHAIRGWRWRLTLAPLGYKPANSSCVYSIFIAYAANLVVPRVGEVSRCVVLERYDKVPFAQSLGTLVSERLVDTVMVVTITLIAVLSQWRVFYAFVAESGVTDTGSVFSSIGRIVVFFLCFIAVSFILYLIVRKMSLWVKLRSFFSRFWSGFTSLSRMQGLWLFIVETVGIWLCYFLQFYLCFFCFPFSEDISLWAALLLFVAGSIAVVVPTPNGAGPWHFCIMGIMMLYGVSSTDAGVFALIVHSLQTLLVALLGIFGLIMLQIKKQ